MVHFQGFHRVLKTPETIHGVSIKPVRQGASQRPELYLVPWNMNAAYVWLALSLKQELADNTAASDHSLIDAVVLPQFQEIQRAREKSINGASGVKEPLKCIWRNTIDVIASEIVLNRHCDGG